MLGTTMAPLSVARSASHWSSFARTTVRDSEPGRPAPWPASSIVVCALSPMIVTSSRATVRSKGASDHSSG